MINQQKHTTITCTIPLCFYNTESISNLEAPETIYVTLYGKREDLISLDRKNMSAHIDARSLKQGTNYILLKEHYLCLPSTISIKSYTPAPLLVTYILAS